MCVLYISTSSLSKFLSIPGLLPSGLSGNLLCCSLLYPWNCWGVFLFYLIFFWLVFVYLFSLHIRLSSVIVIAPNWCFCVAFVSAKFLLLRVVFPNFPFIFYLRDTFICLIVGQNTLLFLFPFVLKIFYLTTVVPSSYSYPFFTPLTQHFSHSALLLQCVCCNFLCFCFLSFACKFYTCNFEKVELFVFCCLFYLRLSFFFIIFGISH